MPTGNICIAMQHQGDAEGAQGGRTIAGANRPMAGKAKAMDERRRILAGPQPLLCKGRLAFDTSGQIARAQSSGLRDATESALADEAIAGLRTPGVDTQKNMH